MVAGTTDNRPDPPVDLLFLPVAGGTPAGTAGCPPVSTAAVFCLGPEFRIIFLN